MSKLMRCIESFEPCSQYIDYVDQGFITPEMSLDDFLSNENICIPDREWVLENILAELYNYHPNDIAINLRLSEVYFYEGRKLDSINNHMEDIRKYIDRFK